MTAFVKSGARNLPPPPAQTCRAVGLGSHPSPARGGTARGHVGRARGSRHGLARLRFGYVSATFQLPPRFARWALCAPPGEPALPRAPLRRSQRAHKPVRGPRATRRRRGARSVVWRGADSCKTGEWVHFCTHPADERLILTPAAILQYFTQYSAPSAPILMP